MWRKHPGIEARSAGTSPNARHPVSARDVEWADVIFVMESKHKQRLMAEHRWKPRPLLLRTATFDSIADAR